MSDARVGPHPPLEGARPVSWLELFYDLVFVASIVTFSDAVSHDASGDVIVTVTIAFAAVWWIWVATTLFANRFRCDDATQRALVLAQMILLTLIALVVGDDPSHHEGFISVAYALLCADVSIMHGRQVRHSTGELARFARARRNEYALVILPLLAATFFEGPLRYALWILAILIVVLPALSYRFGRVEGETPIDEDHLVERLGLLTIIVCGESFVKVSLLASVGSLESLDMIVLATLFVLVFAMWWSYFDDIPEAGLPPGVGRLRGWLVGHLFLQTFLVGVAVGYSKLLRLDLGDNLDLDKMLISVGPLIGVYLSLAVIGACTRRVPVRPLLTLRLVSAAALVPIGILEWRADWIDVEATAMILAAFALIHGGLASYLERSTRVLSPEEAARG
jgi:low temperature requirement protein LtrA